MPATMEEPTSLPVLSRDPHSASPSAERNPSSDRSSEEDVEKKHVAAAEPAQGQSANSGGGMAAVSWKLKLPALICVIFLTLGSNFCGSSLSPLKSTIKKEMSDVTNARYGAISSSTHLINGVLPILSGILIDYYGPSKASLLCSTFILIGAIVTAIGGWKRSFGVLLAGEIIQGIGSTSIETAQSKLYTHWFKGTKEGGASTALMGFVFGLDIAMGRVFNLMGGLTAIPVADSTGVWYWSFWLGAILCAVTFGINVAYLMMEKALPKGAVIVSGRQLVQQREAERQRREAAGEKATEAEEALAAQDPLASRGASGGLVPFVASHLKYLAQSFWTIPAAFWLIAISQLLQSGVVSAYSSNSSETIQLTRGSTRLTAGYTSSLSQVIPIVMTPLVGLFFDRFGNRMHFVSGTAALWVLVFALIAYAPSVHPLAPVLLGSVALSSNAIPFIAGIPLLVPSQASIGTAFGIWKAFNSNGSTIVDVATGAIQDGTPGGGYGRVYAFLIALKSVDIIFGLFYHGIDKRCFNGVLAMSEPARVQKEREQDEQETKSRFPLMRAHKAWSVAGLAVAASLIITAYAVYIVYSFTA